jgi:UDP-N-acetylglucosamine:LPS N-acetylglucosamine transferase
MTELNNNTLILTAVIVGALFAICAVRHSWRKYDLSAKTLLITGGSRGLNRDEAELDAPVQIGLGVVQMCWWCRVM